MSFATLIGVIFGFGLLVGSIIISTDNYMAFLDLPSTLMVVGGTIAASYMSYQPRYVKLGLLGVWHMIKKPKSSREGLNTEIMRLIKWAYIVQSKGVIALENEARSTPLSDGFVRFATDMVATGYKPDDLRKILETAVETTFERNTVPVDVLKNMASNAPAFGMLGTLVGLVVMLQSLGGGDMKEIGVGLAVALITTLYGIILARLIFMPAAYKMQQKEEIERFRNYLIVEGMVMLAEKQSPRYMQDRLNSFLDPAIHFNIDKQLRK
jgi:chemotaxis protein MotA